MSTEQNILEAMKSDAYLAYLELCNALNEVPRREIYNAIRKCDNIKMLNEITSVIEKNHSDFEKGIYPE